MVSQYPAISLFTNSLTYILRYAILSAGNCLMKSCNQPKGIIVSAEKKEITHDSLQEQIERTLNILKQRETGCFTWHMALNEALSELHNTLCPLFKKSRKKTMNNKSESEFQDAIADL